MWRHTKGCLLHDVGNFQMCFQLGTPWSGLQTQGTTVGESHHPMHEHLQGAILWNLFVKPIPMSQLVKDGKQFKHFLEALCATGVRFQQANRPTGTTCEAAPCCSTKHKLHGCKTENSVSPHNGVAITSSTTHCRGRTPDMSIRRQRADIHEQLLQKTNEEEIAIDDRGELHEEFPHHWAELLDKGHMGLQRESRAIIPSKKPPNGCLSEPKLTRNQNHYSSRAIMERFHGRELSLFNIMEKKFVWSEEKHDTVHMTCTALTNCHMTLHPLTKQDALCCRKVLAKMRKAAHDESTKKKERQKKHRVTQTQLNEVMEKQSRMMQGFTTL